MGPNTKRLVVLFQMAMVGAGLGCGRTDESSDDTSWSALLADGDPTTIAPASAVASIVSPLRVCDDCTRVPLARWSLDDCQAGSATLADTAFTSSISHPAFRAVGVACAAGVDGQAVKLAAKEDVVYAPDQPDFTFDRGLTIAAWIKPDAVTGTQSIARKRLDASSSFTLALDSKKLTFVVRLTTGALVGVTAPVQAGRFTHVAATYDGQQALLYLDGVLAAKTKGVGTIGAGAGPIFLGNDADGRLFKGILDEVWLNTVATPEDVIKELAAACLRKAAVVSLSPGSSPPETAGSTAPFDFKVTNKNSASCPAEPFGFTSSVSTPLSAAPTKAELVLGPGQTSHISLNVKSLRMSSVGSYPVTCAIADVAAPQLPSTAQASYVVGTGHVSCDGSPPESAAISGAPFDSLIGGPYSFAASGLAAPTASNLLGADGHTILGMQVNATPGATTDPANNFLGVGWGFVPPSCVDASAFTGIKFTIGGDLGTCALRFTTTASEDSAATNGGVCTAGACFSGESRPLNTGSQVVHFANLVGGSPVSAVDPAALTGLQWQLNVPTDGVTAPCAASFTISDVAFVSDNGVDQIAYTFDKDTRGWAFNTFVNPGSTNLAVTAPGGGPVASVSFDGTSGQPTPGSLKVTAPFSDFNQYVDVAADLFPGVNLSGRTLHAQVRLLSGSFPASGGVFFSVNSGSSFTFGGGTFIGAAAMLMGSWTPVAFDLTTATGVGFDPTQVVQLNMQFQSGSPAGTFTPGPPAVFEIDTVTD